MAEREYLVGSGSVENEVSVVGRLKASTAASMTRRMTGDTESEGRVWDGRGGIGVLHGGIISAGTSHGFGFGHSSLLICRFRSFSVDFISFIWSSFTHSLSVTIRLCRCMRMRSRFNKLPYRCTLPNGIWKQ